jgi:hypothetical protein
MKVIRLPISGIGVHQNLVAKLQVDVLDKFWPNTNIAPGYVGSEAHEKCKIRKQKSPA